jgi:ubiquinone/menaquinone biosynthesis C-methylase UbiE
MPLTETYASSAIHDDWHRVYRQNRLQQRLNDKIYEKAFAIMNLPAGAQVLDAGCGTGDHAFRFAQAGFNVTAVDISDVALERARQAAAQLPITFRRTPLETLPFPNDTFDAVHCRGVLMHIPDWKSSLRELCRVLRPGGTLMVMEANQRSLEALIVRVVRNFVHTDSRLDITRDGLEFWSDHDGKPFVVRMANIDALRSCMSNAQVDPTRSFSDELFDINRFPAGWIRNSVVRLNGLWLRCNLPFGSGTVMFGAKR